MPRQLLIDIGPLRRSRDLRALLAGQVVSVLGTQMTAVAVPYQVYKLTHSSLNVGLVLLAARQVVIIQAQVTSCRFSRTSSPHSTAMELHLTVGHHLEPDSQTCSRTLEDAQKLNKL